jgi:ankyrin repeat protein
VLILRAPQLALISALFVGCARSSSIPPLIQAIDQERIVDVRTLLANGADPNTRGLGGQSALKDAVIVNSRLLTEMLLRAGADPIERAQTTLLMAVAQDRISLRGEADGGEPESIEVAQLLVEAGVDPCARSTHSASSGLRASEFAARDRREKVQAFLVAVETHCRS